MIAFAVFLVLLNPLCLCRGRFILPLVHNRIQLLLFLLLLRLRDWVAVDLYQALIGRAVDHQHLVGLGAAARLLVTLEIFVLGGGFPIGVIGLHRTLNDGLGVERCGRGPSSAGKGDYK